ncbi:MAG: hypothetical protein IKP00_15730 [Victivallales bacterium]|nr:hypothetical protein [Victivallales bacterium]
MKNKLSFILALTAFACIAENVFIPRMKESPIKLDGIVNQEEYTRASLVEGMVQYKSHRLVNRNVSVLITSTEKALYLTMSNPVEESDVLGGFITSAKTGGRVFADDCVEFFVLKADGTKAYQFIVNAANATVVFVREANAKPSQQEIPFKSASQVHDAKWEVEVELPWSSMPEIDPKEFCFNVARNFVRAGVGYANLTGTDNPMDVKRQIAVKALEGFPGVKVYGVDNSLIAGKFSLRMEYEGGVLTGIVREKGAENVFAVPGKVVELPEQNYPYKSLVYTVKDPKLGMVQIRGGVPFEMGKTLTDGPVTEKRKIAGLGYSYLRHYPGYNKFSILLDSIGEGSSAVAEVVGPDGTSCQGALTRRTDGFWHTIIDLPTKRPMGEWVGKIVVKGDEGKESTYENAFGFTEKSFPFMEKRLGLSTKVLAPFEPITLKDNELDTVLRKHYLAQDGLLNQVNAKGAEIFTQPLGFELVVGGKLLEEHDATMKVLEAAPHIVRTLATARIGNWGYRADTVWEYDGFARVRVRLTPPPDEAAERLTLCAHLRPEEASLFNSMVDLARGNPAGAIPTGQGKVWDSSKLPRRLNQQGLPVIPGEFTPYLWFGGEERGLSLVFNSPRGFDLLDGVPMIRLVREADSVKAECDIVSRAGGKAGKPIDFEFCFQVTPVKPRMPGWKNWVFHFGHRLPGMIHIMPYEHDSAVGMWTRFAKLPPNNDYTYAKAYKATMTKRVPSFDIGKHFDEVDAPLMRKYYEAHEGFFKQHRNIKDADAYVKSNRWRMLDMQLGQHAMTIDRVVPYSCPTIIPMEDEAYQYHKAEWANLKPYWEGIADRCFLTPRYIDYLLWTYDKQLEAGMDGIYLDELYVFPQTNPELSPVRDYKNRVIPEMSILATRELVKRIAYLLDMRRRPERLLVIHFTNTLIVPAFSFATVGLDWEYHVETNMEDYVTLEHIRAHSTGLQTGMVPLALTLPKIADKPPKISVEEYLKRSQRINRTCLGLMLQHGITSTNNIFGDYREHWMSRYAFWAFGTHKDDCEFIPYYTKEKPFSVTGEFIVGGYRRGHSLLLIVTNLGKEGDTLLSIDSERLGISKDAVVMDVATNEKFPLDGEKKLHIKECDYRLIFVGPQEFGEMLTAPEPDRSFAK